MKFTKEHKNKISEARKRFFRNGGKVWNYGIPMSKEMKLNLSIQRKGKRLSPKTEFKKGQNMNEKNINWRSDKVGYFALHSWINRKLGKPKKCEYCNTSEANKFEWACKKHSYSRNLEHWIRLCTSCHRLYDLNKIKLC